MPQAEVLKSQFKLLFEFGFPEVVKADKNRMQWVLLNLLDNALKFTEGGEI
jgi:signal transduction histidine kinase